MDTRIKYIAQHGIIVGQWWRRIGGLGRKRICRMTQNGRIVMDMPPKMLGPLTYTVEELLRDWELVIPVKLRTYTQLDGIERVQIFGYQGYEIWGEELWLCVGEFKNV